MLRRHEGRPLFLRDVPRDADQSAQLAKAQGELSTAAGPSLGLPEDFQDCRAVEVRDLPIFRDLLRDEPDQLEAVVLRVHHRGLHVDLVSVSADAGPQRRVHPLDRVQVSRGDEDEVAWDRLRLDHGAGRALALPDDREFLLLHRGQQALLALHAEDVDLVDEEDALVGLVDRAGFDALVRGRLKAAALEGIVLDVPEQGASVTPRRVDERRHFIGRMTDEELRDHQVLLTVTRVPRRDVDDRRDQDPEQDDVRGIRAEARLLRAPLVGEDDAQADDEEHDRHHHRGLLLPTLHRLRLLGVHDLPALAGGDDADLGFVRVLGIVIHDDVLEVVPGQEFRHRPGQHRLPGARVADQHDMPLLFGGFADDFDGPFLTDDLVHEPFGDLHFRRGPEVDLVNPRIHGREFFRFSRCLHHLLDRPLARVALNTRAFYLNTLTLDTLVRFRKSHS